MAPNRKPNNTPALVRLGISEDDAQKLRRVEARLHRWHELECGIAHPLNETWTVCIERDEKTGRTSKRVMGHDYSGQYFDRRHYCADDETLAHKRLASIMEAYPELYAFVQGDPRGCALYIIPRHDVVAAEAKGEDASYIYSSRGVAVY
jgi:hypothetical protein